MDKPRRLLPLKELVGRGCGCRSTIYRKMNAGIFPLPVRRGENSNGWWEDEIDEWLETRPRVVSLGPKPEAAEPDAEQPAAA